MLTPDITQTNSLESTTEVSTEPGALQVGRARLRQKVPDRPPRAIPDRLWDELFAAMDAAATAGAGVAAGIRAAGPLSRRGREPAWW
ncbi:hypothetical protein Misp01_61790 [Microtetraspora sp. NBRC 13810]|nr:hypothetical protein Misp01_61790 [Microtetraspora sp. NBRC 13810]